MDNVLYVVLGIETRDFCHRYTDLEEDARKNGLVVFGHGALGAGGEVHVYRVTFLSGKPEVKQGLRGDTVLGKTGTEALLDGLFACGVRDWTSGLQVDAISQHVPTISTGSVSCCQNAVKVAHRMQQSCFV
jgi:hypothetical protein